MRIPPTKMESELVPAFRHGSPCGAVVGAFHVSVGGCIS